MKNSLERHIGLVGLTIYGVGDILGAGVYGLIGKAAGEMGNTVWLAFLTSMIAAGLTGLSYAALGSRFPRAGGASYIVHRTFKNTFLAYVVGLVMLASGLTSMATGSRAFAGYFVGAIPSVPIEVVALAFVILLGGIVFWGIRESLAANIVCTAIEVGGLLFLVAVGARYLGSVDLLNAVTVENAAGDITLSLVLSGAVLTFYSFIGFEDTLNVAEEVIEPKKTVPRALLLALGIASIVYLAVSVVAVSVVPAMDLANSPEPLVQVVRKAAPWFPTSVYSVIAMFAVANTALLNFVMGSRLIYGMSNQGLLPKKMGHVHKKRKTPHIAILAMLLILFVFVLVGDIASLAKATSVLLLSVFFLVNISLITLKWRKDKERGHFDIPILVPIAGAIICVMMLSFAQAKEVLLAMGVLACIVILYFAVRPSKDAVAHLD